MECDRPERCRVTVEEGRERAGGGPVQNRSLGGGDVMDRSAGGQKERRN